MTRGESVQPLQSVKLIYQPCSRSRAAWTSSRLDGSGFRWVVPLVREWVVLVVDLDGIQLLVWFSEEKEEFHLVIRC